MIELYEGRAEDIMPTLPQGCADAIIADIPYGTTACAWDVVIPFDVMWQCIKRVIKPRGAVLLFGVEPYSSLLRCSNIKQYRYDWIWEKQAAANFFFGNKQPLKLTENISAFYQMQPTYNPQKMLHPKGAQKLGGIRIGERSKNLRKSHPEAKLSGRSWEPDKLLPTNILRFNKEHKPIHPTQKPVALMEYLIKTYTNEGETVLDFTMGSGTTGVAAYKTGRDFIGIESDETYFEIASKRIAQAQMQPQLALTA